MSDPLYAKLTFTGWHVYYDADHHDLDNEFFDARELMMNGFETIPSIQDFIYTVKNQWCRTIIRITDKDGNELYCDESYVYD